MTSIFNRACDIILQQEGDFTNDPRDSGNWSGGQIGQGHLFGTRHGISSGAYPDLDIAALTATEARVIYRRDYWDRLHADQLPPSLALLTFDASVNCGVSRSIRWLQQAVRVIPDGYIGPKTLVAVQTRCSDDIDKVCVEMLAARLIFLSGLPTWATFRLGWSQRMFHVSIEATRLENTL